MPKKLTDTQLVVLSHAAMQIDGVLLPAPKSVRLNAGALTTVLRSLLNQGLALERPAARDQVAWRQEETGERHVLVISDQGCIAIGVEPVGTGSAQNQTEQAELSAKTTALPNAVGGSDTATDVDQPRAGTKLLALTNALRAPDGATIQDLMTTTGWQAHSVRGAISGALKKTFKLDVTSTKIEGRGRVYAIAAQGRGK